MARCSGCGAEIHWFKTRDGKNMPVDTKKTTIVTQEGEVITGYQSHFATCPKADEFRRR